MTQSELANGLAAEFGLELIRFRQKDGLVFESGEVLKIFVPRSKRIMGCGPKDRLVIGDLLCLFQSDLRSLRPPSKKFQYDRQIFSAPDANFSSLRRYAINSNGSVDAAYKAGLKMLFDALPSTRAGWLDQFGEDFFELSTLERMSEGIKYLRARSKSFGTPFGEWEPPANIKVTIEPGG